MRGNNSMGSHICYQMCGRVGGDGEACGEVQGGTSKGGRQCRQHRPCVTSGEERGGTRVASSVIGV